MAKRLVAEPVCEAFKVTLLRGLKLLLGHIYAAGVWEPFSVAGDLRLFRDFVTVVELKAKSAGHGVS